MSFPRTKGVHKGSRVHPAWYEQGYHKPVKFDPNDLVEPTSKMKFNVGDKIEDRMTGCVGVVEKREYGIPENVYIVRVEKSRYFTIGGTLAIYERSAIAPRRSNPSAKSKNPAHGSIGTTESGKPIPSGNSAIYSERYRWPKWNRTITVVDEPKLMRRVFVNYTSQDHKDAARVHAADAKLTAVAHGEVYAAAVKKYGEAGPVISGIFRAENFPNSVKDALRGLARESSAEISIAHAHWKASGARSACPYAKGWQYSL